MSNEPIKSGDSCLVVGGVFEDKAPNLGKTVTVMALRGEHSQYGRIWACSGKDLVTEYGGVGSNADFAASWLQKIQPPEQNTQTKSQLNQPEKTT